MKKVFVLIAAAIVSMSAMAQVQFGAKVGVDMTNFWGSDTEHGMQPNYQAGALMEYKFSDHFGIAPEIVFAAQGGKHKAGGVTTKFNTNYINIPVMLKFYASDKFSVDFGPQLGINVYSKFTVSGGGADVTTDIKDGTKTVDFGLGLGGTYNLTEKAFVQARYTMGLTEVFKDEVSAAKNGNIQLAFGMKF